MSGAQKRPASAMEDEFSKFEAEIAQMSSEPAAKKTPTSAPSTSVTAGPTGASTPAVHAGPVRPVPPAGPNPFTPMVGPTLPAPMMQGPVMPGPMMPSSFPPYMPPGAVPGPNYPRPMMGPQMGMGVAGPWMSMPTQPGLPQHNYPSEEQIAQINAANQAQEKKGKKKEKVDKSLVRHAAGKTWIDESLSEWDPADHRIFVGDLGNDVTDDMLGRMFCGYPSYQKARVIRDKRTSKSRGYGFVSFKDAKDFVKAMKEMNGRYCGHRPMKLRKSEWDERMLDVRKQRGDMIRLPKLK